MFRISGPYISVRIAELAERAGLGKGYSGHSCRIGMAQDLAAEGYSLTQLMTAGRWANPAMPARYTRNEAAARNAVVLYYRQLSLFAGPAPVDKPPVEQRLFTEENHLLTQPPLHKTPGQNKDMRLTRQSGEGRLG